MKFEVSQDGRRKPRWGLRDSKSGAVIPLSPGRVHLPPTTKENRHVRDAVDSVLSRLARNGGAITGGE